MTSSVPIKTGSLGLDIALGGGWTPGTINEIWGEPGSGKTTLARHTVQGLVPLDGRALWMSLGTEMPPKIFGAVLTLPKNAEDAFEVMNISASHGMGLIVVDSANGLVRQAELDGDPDYIPHPQREYRGELRALKAICKRTGTTVLFLSKPRDRDREPVRGTGISEKAKDRVELRIVHEYQDQSRDVRATVKGHDASSAEFRIDPGSGINWAHEMAHLAVQYGVATRSAAWFRYGSEKFLGLSSFQEYLRENRDAAEALENAIRALAIGTA